MWPKAGVASGVGRPEHRIDATNSDPFFTEYNGLLYFRANNASGVAKLFVYDDVRGVLSQVSQIRAAGTADLRWTRTTPFALYANRMAFHAYSTAGGEKVFTLCDAAAGCTP